MEIIFHKNLITTAFKTSKKKCVNAVFEIAAG